MKNYFTKAILCFLLLLFLVSSVSYAQTVGKIGGTVTDATTGEALPGVNIMIEGSQTGGASNIKGEYYIINVPPGKYTIRATMIGYTTTRVTDVQVHIGLTTQLDFNIEPTVIVGEEVIVTAERPILQKDITSKISIVSSDEILNLPVENFQEVLTTKAGFTTDADGNIHVRGGRTGEIAYMIDGTYVDDPLNGGFNGMMNRDAIEEMILLSGTFNAEYGNAMSSIVNIVTKEGGEAFHGKVEYTSPMINESPYRKSNPFSGVTDTYEYTEKSIIDKLKVPFNGIGSLTFSGPVPFISGFTFLMSGRLKNEDSYLPHGYSLQRDLFGKFTYRISAPLKVSLSGQVTQDEFQRYDHQWKYLSENQVHSVQNTTRLGLTLTHTLSSSLFYNAQLNYFVNDLTTQVGDKLPKDYVRGQTGETVYFYVKGDDSEYADDRTETYSAKMDLNFQANNYNFFKGGFELKSHKIQVHEESAPWPGGIQYKDEYEKNPIEVAGYIQDKIEYDYLIVNVGLRMDYADPKSSMWKDITRFGYFDENNNWVPAPEEEVSPKTQLSPRVGLAHPITDQAVLHFSYGHFFQNPDYSALYYNQGKDLSASLPLVGNPGLDAEKTVAYETGIKYKLSDDWALDISAWYKDITDLLSTQQVTYLSKSYVVFYNSDYASVKGFDMTLRKRYSNYFSGSIDYTFMIAKGNNSQPLGGYIDAFSQEEIPHQEFYLDFDQRHDIAVSLNLNIPKDTGPELFGIKPFSDFNLNLLFQAASGLPYTPYVDPTVRIEVNSARQPWTSTLDIRMIKRIWISSLAAAFFLEVTNLLNTENVRYVYPRTGKPFDTGVTGLVGSSPDANYNPNHLGPPRIIKAGVQFIW